ncbi:MAG: Na/Pi cotransporter family protein [Bacteroidetes bacterium]|mgnify:FL=1|nr:Na/Pi cotransporter family protein [Bacteroidota bacterium]MBT5530282.1 Na/Pi cotransporter family protein [Cytophagia bacterium]MBT3801183.1 Na/Pi cotransporter family protein [Bacteroidota bacterium]MBT4728711.1 Na/Pi cotransporter family protein [Bacteroidota bacterium]MBT4969445.1 Na/Pi cotransporter family protein [Bacteroidota bacterium]
MTSWGIIIKVLVLIGSLGFFLYGMKLMSESLQKVAGKKMKSILSAMTSNRIKGVFTGFLVTTVIQSSSATTVMLVSFVNAGLLTLLEATGVIMGANIGTTVTAWIISLLGFKVSLSALSLPLIGLSLPLFFSSNERRKTWGEFIVGFAILFLGLQALKEAVPDIKSNPEILAFLSNYIDFGYWSVFIFIIVGTILTVVIQSSSATMALTLVLCYNGLIPFHIAAAMVLGENIGTTITANIAAIIGNVNAKRAARSHLIFNLIGVIWMIIFFFPFLRWIDNIVEFRTGFSILDNSSAVGFEKTKEILPIALAVFHTIFNIINTSLLIGFAPFIVKMTKWMVSSTDLSEDDDSHLQVFRSGFVSTSEISILQASKELSRFAKQIKKMIHFIPMLIEKNEKKIVAKAIKKIKKHEILADGNMEALSLYFAQISKGKISEQSSNLLKSYFRVNNELESIGDSCFKIAGRIEKVFGSKNEFKKEERNKLNELFELIDNAFDLAYLSINGKSNENTFKQARKLEFQINELRDDLIKNLMERINLNELSFEVGMVYKDVISAMEKMGDYIYNIQETLFDKNKVEEFN